MLRYTGKDILPGKTHTKVECDTLLNKDLTTVARQINPHIKVLIQDTTRGALYSLVPVTSYVAGHMRWRQSKGLVTRRNNSLTDVCTGKTVIEYRKILRREKICDLPVPWDGVKK